MTFVFEVCILDENFNKPFPSFNHCFCECPYLAHICIKAHMDRAFEVREMIHSARIEDGNGRGNKNSTIIALESIA